MAYIMQRIYKFGELFDTRAKWMVCCHPYIAFLSVFIGVPIFILTAVGICTTAIVLPISWIIGWI